MKMTQRLWALSGLTALLLLLTMGSALAGTPGVPCPACGDTAHGEIIIPGSGEYMDALGAWGHRLQCGNCGQETGSAACSGGTAICEEGAKCAGCGAEYTAPRGHDFQLRWVQLPACEQDGIQGSFCSHCDTQNPDVPIAAVPSSALSHSFLEYVPDGNATCTEDGTQTATCDYGCGETDTIREPDTALGHDDVTIQGKAATCTEAGVTEGHYCARCGEILSAQKTIPPLGHWYGVWNGTLDGNHQAACIRCGHELHTACQRMTATLRLDGEEAPRQITLCPVCGEVQDAPPMQPASSVSARPITGTLALGNVSVYVAQADQDVHLLTVGVARMGRLVRPTGIVQVTLPTALLDGCSLMLLSPEGGETPLSLLPERDVTSFHLDFSALEKEEAPPAFLIRLVKE